MDKFKKAATASCLAIMGLTFSGCELLAPYQPTKLPLTPVQREKPEQKPAVVFSELQNKPPVPDALRTKSEQFLGTDRFVPSSPAQHRRIDKSGPGTYSLNFDEADLGEVAKVVLSDILGQNYVLSPKVVGKVTLQTTQPLTKEELLPTLEMVLRMNGAALVKDGKIYHIEPSADALYSSDITGAHAGYQTRVIPVKFVAVEDIIEIIKPLVQEKTILTVDGTRNILVASGTPDEIARVMDMVSTFDIDVLKGRSFGLFPLAHVEPETIIDELEEVFDRKGAGEDNSFFRFIPIERLNAVMAITHQGHYLNDVETWVRRLDRANTAAGGGVNVYKVQHADAEELADTLNEIFTGAAKKDKSAKVAPGQKASSISNKSTTDKPADAKPASASSSGSSRRSGSSGSSGSGDAKVANVGDVRIISDKANNALIIVATPREYQEILPVIKQLDILPLQVLIDATIVSVNLTDKLSYGIKWYLQHGGGGQGVVTINKGSDLVAAPAADAVGTTVTTAATAVATGGLGYAFVGNAGAIRAVLNMAASDDNINIISSPSLMVLNNQQATIEVGDQVPVLSSTLSTAVSGGSTGIAQSNQIQYKDTGTKLEITPRVNANGMVIMEIKQSDSSAKVNVENTGINSATISKKEINTFVAIQDGETIVLGGLISSSDTYNKNGIPFLYKIPWIGPLFGNTDITKLKNELVVLITPRVVKSKQDSRVISNEFKRKLTGIYEDRTTYKR